MSINLIFLIIQLLNEVQSNIAIKFEKLYPINEESQNMAIGEFVIKRIANEYVTEINIGEPPQKIPGFLRTKKYEFLISNDFCPQKAYYYKEKSKSFSYPTTLKDYNYVKISETLHFYSSPESKDYDVKIENYTIYSRGQIIGSQCFYIGTQLLINRDEKDTNLIDGLHKKKYIKSYFYEYQIKNEDEMFLILDLDDDFENTKKYKFIKPLITPYTYVINHQWGLTFQNLYLNAYNVSYDKETRAEFDINCGGILGNHHFEAYFKNFLKENDIYAEYSYEYEYEYKIYFFNKDNKGIEKIKNISLVFYNKELKYNFTFNYKDLILEKEKGYYFLIYFEFNKFRSNWRFGFPFFKKYHFVFNHDSKLMGFKCPNGCSETNSNNIYIKNNNVYEIKDEKINNNNTNDILKNNNKELINEEENRKFGFKIIIIMFLGIIFIVAVILFFGIFIGKKMFGVRKNKVNELLELYDYSSANKKKEVKKESSKDNKLN